MNIRNKVLLVLTILIIMFASVVIVRNATQPYPLHYWLSKHLNENDIIKISIIVTPLHEDRVEFFLIERSDIVTAWKGISEISETRLSLNKPSKYSTTSDYFISFSDSSGLVSITPMLSMDNKTYYLYVNAYKYINTENAKELILTTSSLLSLEGV